MLHDWQMILSLPPAQFFLHCLDYCMHGSMLSHSVLSNSVGPQGLLPARLLSRRTQSYQHLYFCIPKQLGTEFMLFKVTWSVVIAHGSLGN